MRFPRAKERSPIGIDVGRRSVKAVQLERAAGGEWSVSAAVVLPRAVKAAGEPVRPTADELRKLVDVLERQSFHGAEVALAASDGLLSSILELPPLAPGAPVEQIARIELSRTHRMAPDAFEMGCWDLPTPARAHKATYVMAVALPHVHAEPLLDAFESQGLRVCGIDIRTCAIARACHTLTDTASITAIVDLGWGAAEVALLYRDAIIYCRSLPDAGLSRLRESISRRLRVEDEMLDYILGEVGLPTSPAEESGGNVPAEARDIVAAHVDALVQELLASFSYATHQYPDASVTRVLLVGGGSQVPGVVEHVGTGLRIETRAATPLSLATCADSAAQACSSGALTAALGLAQYPR